ncbi:PRC-barrel domain containing protein [Halorussus salinus]|uniref:PRC-barrel domain containing protein n=1 Tax=Halorussus salinus TaxID=1364935 RepID=UPI0010933021|nr:PRC-barrel domain containing protein [Halorussus salinus]
MNEPLTEEAEGKRIVSHDGETVGTVTKVDQGVAHVDPEDPETSQQYLDRADSSDEDYTVQETAVEEATADEIVLKKDGER